MKLAQKIIVEGYMLKTNMENTVAVLYRLIEHVQ